MPNKEVNFRLRMFKAGTGWVSKDSIDGGVIDNNGNASFQGLSIDILGFDKQDLKRDGLDNGQLAVEIACVFVNHQALNHSEFQGPGQESPPGCPANCDYLQSIRMKLVGSTSFHYDIIYGVNVLRQSVHAPWKHDETGFYRGWNGSECGFTDVLPGFYVWINSLSVRITAKV